MSIKDDCEWQKIPECIKNLRQVILADRRQTIHVVCDIIGLSYRNMQHILLDELGMRLITANFMPRLLSDKKGYQVRDDATFIITIEVS